MIGGYYALSSLYIDEPKVTKAFQMGEGVGWGDHSSCLFCGTEKFFRPGYEANLVSEWLPALGGVVDKLERGGKVADVGCGHGVSTLIMAKAFPKTEFIGLTFISRRSIARQSWQTNRGFRIFAMKWQRQRRFPGTIMT